jgi:hypothetical protein
MYSSIAKTDHYCNQEGMPLMDSTPTVVGSSTTAVSSIAPSDSISEPGHMSYPFAVNSIQHLIATTFDIPVNLTGSTRDLRLSYAKYLKYQEVCRKITAMRSEGTWTRKTIEQDIISVFFSKATFYKYPAKVFRKVSNNPKMESWLRNGDNPPSTEEVWGSMRPNFGNLSKMVGGESDDEDSQEENGSGSEVEMKKRKKGKGKNKESDIEIETPVKKNGKGKKSHKRAKKM